MKPVEKLLGAAPPAEAQGMLAATLARDIERRPRGLAEIIIERPRAAPCEQIDRPGHRIGRDRKSRGQRLKHDEAEGIGAAWKNEHIGGGIELREHAIVAPAEEMHIGEAP